MHITFYCDSIPFHLDSLSTEPLGGTESSVLSLAKELSRKDFDVTIIGNTQTYHTKDRIEFIPVHSIDLKYLKTDVFISVRDPEVIVNNDLSNFSKVIFWSHDVIQHPSIEHLLNNTNNILDKIDNVVILSDYVRNQLLLENNETLNEKLVIIRNGVDTDFICSPNKDSDIINCVYHSMPYRGVVYLLEMWGRIVEKSPNCQLHLYTGNQIYGSDDSTNNWIWNRATRYGVNLHGAVCQKELLENLSKMDLHLYPTDFVESSCTATMMSLASGCSVITTDLGALREHINNDKGELISGHPGNEEYQKNFINSVVSLSQNKELLRQKQKNSLEMLSNSWKNISKEWINLFRDTK